MKYNYKIIVLIVVLVLFANSTIYAATLYSVRDGDTLAYIAQKYGITIDDILSSNKDVSSGKSLKQGKVLIIPSPGEKLNVQMVKDPKVIEIKATPDDNYTGSYTNINRSQDRVSITIRGNSSKINSKKSLGSRGALVQGIIKGSMKYLGVPYVWGGTSPSGFDCSGFTMRVFQQNGIYIPRTADEQYYQGSKIQRSELLPGDLVFFETYMVGPSHVGIYIGNGQFIHASSRGCVTISSLSTSFYSSHFCGAARY